MVSMSSSSRSRSSSSLQCSKTSSSISDSFTSDTIIPEQRPKFVQPGLKTLTWPDDKGALSIIYATRICAPIALVASALLDTRSYTSWNRFCPTIQVNSQPRSTAPLPPIIAHDPSVTSVANLPTTLRDGAVFTMQVMMDAASSTAAFNPPRHPSGTGRTTPELQISALDQYEREDGRTCVRIAWRTRGKVVSLLLRNERVHELIASPNDPNLTDYVCWETFYGGLNAAMQTMYGKQMERGYAMWMDGLKKHAEERARGRAMAEEVIETKRSHSSEVRNPPVVSL